jgi:hypothetical protein
MPGRGPMGGAHRPASSYPELQARRLCWAIRYEHRRPHQSWDSRSGHGSVVSQACVVLALDAVRAIAPTWSTTHPARTIARDYLRVASELCYEHWRNGVRWAGDEYEDLDAIFSLVEPAPILRIRLILLNSNAPATRHQCDRRAPVAAKRAQIDPGGPPVALHDFVISVRISGGLISLLPYRSLVNLRTFFGDRALCLCPHPPRPSAYGLGRDLRRCRLRSAPSVSLGSSRSGKVSEVFTSTRSPPVLTAACG